MSISLREFEMLLEHELQASIAHSLLWPHHFVSQWCVVVVARVLVSSIISSDPSPTWRFQGLCLTFEPTRGQSPASQTHLDKVTYPGWHYILVHNNIKLVIVIISARKQPWPENRYVKSYRVNNSQGVYDVDSTDHCACFCSFSEIFYTI